MHEFLSGKLFVRPSYVPLILLYLRLDEINWQIAARPTNYIPIGITMCNTSFVDFMTRYTYFMNLKVHADHYNQTKRYYEIPSNESCYP